MSTHTMGTTTFVVDGHIITVHTAMDKFTTSLSELAEAALENPDETALEVPIIFGNAGDTRQLPAADVRAFLGRRVAAARVAYLENADDEELFQMGREQEIRYWAQM